jgi:hypothetical protein
MTLTASELDYVCRQCTKDESGFKFEKSLRRLRSATEHGIEKIKASAKIEHIFLRNAGIPNTRGEPKSQRTDSIAAELLAKCDKVVVKADGDCLFHALSLAVYSDEDLAVKEMRTRITIELAMNEEWYRDQYNLLDFVSPSISEEVLNACKNGSYASAWSIAAAAATVLYRELRSIYPPVNGVLNLGRPISTEAATNYTIEASTTKNLHHVDKLRQTLTGYTLVSQSLRASNAANET